MFVFRDTFSSIGMHGAVSLGHEVQRLLNLQDAIQLLRSEVMTRIFPASSFRYRLHEGAILRRKRGRPIRLVTRLWQQVPELNHLPRRQLVDVDPNARRLPT
jgi:hypothetical protein